MKAGVPMTSPTIDAAKCMSSSRSERTRSLAPILPRGAGGAVGSGVSGTNGRPSAAIVGANSASDEADSGGLISAGTGS